MLAADILKHAREFSRYIRDFKFEETDRGILFPEAKLTIAGQYEDYMGITKNLIPTQGLNHILDVAIADDTKLNTFYLALYSGNYTPIAGLTAASFTADSTEITSGAEGYSQATRVAWVPANPSAGVIDNYASKAAFTIVTASTLSINGAGLISASTKGATTGVIISAAKFATTRTENNGNVYNLGYRITAAG